MIGPCHKTSTDGEFTFRMTGLDSLTYSMTHSASQRGNTLMEFSIDNGHLANGENQELRTHVWETLDPRTGQFIVDARLVVDIDVKPGSQPNCIDPAANGVIPVAVLGSPTFDVMQIERSSQVFAGLGVGVTGSGVPQCSVAFGNVDVWPDLVCQFVNDPRVWETGQVSAALTGKLLSGTPFVGSDGVCLVPKK
jgi:hypothetical protein